MGRGPKWGIDLLPVRPHTAWQMFYDSLPKARGTAVVYLKIILVKKQFITRGFVIFINDGPNCLVFCRVELQNLSSTDSSIDSSSSQIKFWCMVWCFSSHKKPSFKTKAGLTIILLFAFCSCLVPVSWFSKLWGQWISLLNTLSFQCLLLLMSWLYLVQIIQAVQIQCCFAN